VPPPDEEEEKEEILKKEKIKKEDEKPVKKGTVPLPSYRVAINLFNFLISRILIFINPGANNITKRGGEKIFVCPTIFCT
jgi:hypothetical protein